MEKEFKSFRELNGTLPLECRIQSATLEPTGMFRDARMFTRSSMPGWEGQFGNVLHGFKVCASARDELLEVSSKCKTILGVVSLDAQIGERGKL